MAAQILTTNGSGLLGRYHVRQCPTLLRDFPRDFPQEECGLNGQRFKRLKIPSGIAQMTAISNRQMART
jgi:hypothetical protein